MLCEANIFRAKHLAIQLLSGLTPKLGAAASSALPKPARGPRFFRQMYRTLSVNEDKNKVSQYARIAIYCAIFRNRNIRWALCRHPAKLISASVRRAGYRVSFAIGELVPSCLQRTAGCKRSPRPGVSE